MLQRSNLVKSTGAAALLFSTILAGCTGTSTYGTGVTQEAQLLEDLSSIAMLGSNKKPKKINYAARPTIVKPPTGSAALPAPAETNSTDDGNFPVNPEEKRQATLAAISDAESKGEALPDEVIAARRASASRQSVRPTQLNPADDKSYSHIDPAVQKAQREAYLKRRGELKGATGAGPRQYLTEPPQVYRTPDPSAPIGVTGEKEKNPYKAKKEKSLLGKIFGRD